MKNQCMAKQDGQNGSQDNITDIVLITLRVHRCYFIVSKKTYEKS